MKALRTLHLYLGCLFAPLIVYFCLSGAWQLFELNDVPEDNPSAIRSVLHEISNPHTHSTAPLRSPKVSRSTLFSVASLLAAVGMILTAGIGVMLARQFRARRALVLTCVLAGAILPVGLLYLTR
jgi:hypothetical protein